MKFSFYPIAVLFGIVTLFIGSESQNYQTQSERHKVYSIDAAVRHHMKYGGDAEAVALAHIGNVLSVVGLVLTLFGVGFMVIAKVRHDKGWYLILAGLFIADLLVLMLLSPISK
jgi:hypothetical protein